MTQPNFFLIFSASGMGVRSPTAMSFVKLSPPMGMVAVYQRLPRSKMATSVVPAPMSMSPTPSSFSSWVRTAALVAIWLRTICSMLIPARSTQVRRF